MKIVSRRPMDNNLSIYSGNGLSPVQCQRWPIWLMHIYTALADPNELQHLICLVVQDVIIYHPLI